MLEGSRGAAKRVERREAVVVRLAGDSGDGMQVTGLQLTTESALLGNDLATLPDFPAEIRAPAGTPAGVSAFQLQFASRPVFTPGDDVDALVAMNPAALKANLGDLRKGGILIVDREAFNDQNLRKAGYAANPLDDGTVSHWQVFPVDVTRLTTAAVAECGLTQREAFRCRNFFCLGLVGWLFGRPLEATEQYIREKFGKKPSIADANRRALRAGHAYGENAELLPVSFEVVKAEIAPGTYRTITGNAALALGLVAAAHKADLPIFLGSYPITPASDVLHELAALKHFGVVTFQAEDEIAGVGAALGAAFGGAIGVTTTSGPGMDLKAETIGLAVMTELPLVICDIQRAGPSTGMPTKTEQADLLMAMYGRHGEAPLPIVAPQTPSDCFAAAFEAVRIAVRYMTPVIVLSDGYLANGAEPWAVPTPDQLDDVSVHFRTDPTAFLPYMRDEATLARPWVRPGTPGLEHRIGGLNKEAVTGNVSYSPANHEQMVRTRARKVANIATELPPTEIFGPPSGDLLVLGWGSTFGAIRQAVTELQREGRSVAQAHLRWVNPLPRDLGDVLARYRAVLVPEINLGQLVRIIRAEYLVPAVSYAKIQGRPLKVAELKARCEKILAGEPLEEVA